MTIHYNSRYAAPLKRIGTLAIVVSALTACVADKGGNSSSSETPNSSAAMSSSSLAPSSSSALSSSVAPSSSSQAPASSSSLAPSSSSQSSVASSVSYQVPANNFAVNGDVESGLTNWGTRAGETVEATNAEAFEGSYSLYVTDRTAYWNGATFNVGRLTAGNDYEVAAWVKLAAGEPDTVVKITGKRVDDANTDDYSEYTNIDEQIVSSDSWTLLRGTYTPSGDTPFEYFIIEADTSSSETFASYYVDQFVVAGNVEPEPDPDPIPVGSGLKDLADIPIGVAVNLEGGSRDTFSNATKTQIVHDNFSQMSVENTMKMKYWYQSGDVQKIDALAQRARTNNMSIHGHVLVWHPCYQMPSGWANMSTSQYDTAFTNHVRDVASKHTDVIKSWDVVNEALYDGGDNGADSSCGLQSGSQTVNGVQYRKSTHFNKLGADYIHKAFVQANQSTDADLYYNDFNIENNYSDNGYNKTDNLIALLKDLKTRGTPIDGVGFQMHVGPDWPSVANIKASWQKVLDLNYGLKIKITEMDVRVNWPYGNNRVVTSCSDTQALQAQKQRYKDIVKAYYETVPAPLRGGVTVWGIIDADSWFASFTANGQSYVGCPLLFNDQMQAKPAYDGVLEALNES